MLKVGFIGPFWLEKMIKSCFAMFPNVQVAYRLSDQIEDAVPFAAELDGKVDCFLFSSRAVYVMVREAVQLKTEAHYIPLKGSGLYEALFRLSTERPVRFLSIDGVPEAYIEGILSEADGVVFQMVSHFDSVSEASAIADSHIEAIKGKQNPAVITSLKKVEDILRLKGIPVVWLKPTKEDMIVSIERLLLSASARREREGQIVYGRFSVRLSNGEIPAAKQKVDLERSLSRFVDEMNGHLFPGGGSEYHFIAMRGDLERVTEGYKVLRIFKEIAREEKMSLQLGIGFGISIPVSVYHADLALRQTRLHQENIAFIVNESRNVIGPIDIRSPVVYRLGGDDSNSRNKQIETVKAYLAKNELRHFTSDEVANHLKLTKRAANRIIAGWLDSGVVALAGIEKSNGRGRPRQCYSFRRDADEDRADWK